MNSDTLKPIGQPIIRKMQKCDLDNVLCIERESSRTAETREGFEALISELRQPDSTFCGLVAADAYGAFAYVIYELQRFRVEILNLAVGTPFRRSRVGTRMINEIKRRLEPSCRGGIIAVVNEWDTSAHQFFKFNGFRATRTIRNAWGDDGDGYLFSYTTAAPNGELHIRREDQAWVSQLL